MGKPEARSPKGEARSASANTIQDGVFETGLSCDSPLLPPPLRRAEDSNNTYRLGLSWFWDSSGLGGGGREVVGLDPVAADATRTPVMMFVELASLWRWAGRTGESLALP